MFILNKRPDAGLCNFINLQCTSCAEINPFAAFI